MTEVYVLNEVNECFMGEANEPNLSAYTTLAGAQDAAMHRALQIKGSAPIMSWYPNETKDVWNANPIVGWYWTITRLEVGW